MVRGGSGWRCLRDAGVCVLLCSVMISPSLAARYCTAAAKSRFLCFHDEINGIAAAWIAAKAFEAFGRVNGKGGGTLVVERAKGNIPATTPAELCIVADDAD